MPMVDMIAIDGPAASGKSTLGMRLAAHLGYLYLDTGVMYRAVTLAALERGVSVEDEEGVSELARNVTIEVRLPTVDDDRQYDVLLDGQDVTWQIRTPQVDANVSLVSTYKIVRQEMSRIQREIGLRGKVVMVGRDIGTVVLPEADLKIYLDASVEVRARRRTLENLARGGQLGQREILHGMRERDRIDSNRELAPLEPASDAVIIDSTNKTSDEVYAHGLELIAQVEGGEPEQESAAPSAPAKGNAIKTGDWFPSFGNRIFRAIARPIFRLLMHILCRIQIEGRENIPREGAYLVVINHISLYEAPLMLAFWPRPLETAGAVEVLKRPFQGELMRCYGGLAVIRGRVDRRLLRNMISLLEHGLPLMIAPEGRRSYIPGMGTAWNGAAYVAGKANVPLVPVGITGTESGPDAWKQWRRPLWRMVIGEPFTLPPVPWGSSARKQTLQENTNILMCKIAELLPPEYRGVYG